MIKTDKNMNWIGMKQKFRVEGDRLIHITWDDNEDYMEINLKQE